MCDIADLKMQIEEARAEVQESFGRDSYEITYRKNLKLDKLLEKYIELTGRSSTLLHQAPLPLPTIKQK